MWVKICANTNLEDAWLAAQLGADAVGFVFAPSARQVTSDQVAAIVSGLPAEVEKIGVFSSCDVAEIVGVVRAASLTGVQLHGGIDLPLAHELRSQLQHGVTIIQTLHWAVDGDAEQGQEFAAQLRAIADEAAIDRVLIDSKSSKGIGGTGVSFDWHAAGAAIRDTQKKMIMAGGLNPQNVVEAIATLRPWGVDVASGVEAVPGRKDGLKLQRFIENARLSER